MSRDADGPPRKSPARRSAGACAQPAVDHPPPLLHLARIVTRMPNRTPTGSPQPTRLGLAPRRSSAAAKTAAAQSLQRFVRQEYWNGMAAGDVVRVAGHSARGRHWRFRAHVTNSSNGASWVEVALVEGPAPARRPAVLGGAAAPEALEVPRIEKVRSFEPAIVTPRWRGRGRVAGFRKGADRGNEPATSPAPATQQAALF